MKANPGDHIILAPPQVDGPTRDGEVLEVRGANGAPPYVVRWSDGHVGLLYPGPGSVLRIGPEHPEGEGHPDYLQHVGHQDLAGQHELAVQHEPTGHETAPHAAEAHAGDADQTRHVRDWQVRISVFESESETDAHVVLVADSPKHLSATGHSHRGSHDLAVPEIGDEVAVARALRRLADQLLDTAAEDIETVTGEDDVVLRPR
jgi:hypothetical protein